MEERDGQDLRGRWPGQGDQFGQAEEDDQDTQDGTSFVHPMAVGHASFSNLFDFTLFVGPVTCFHHNRGMISNPSHSAALCLDDAQMALGNTEQCVIDAVGEIIKSADYPIRSVLLLTSCQLAFVGLDSQLITRELTNRYGIVCVRHENNRIMRAAPGRSPGGPGFPPGAPGQPPRMPGFPPEVPQPKTAQLASQKQRHRVDRGSEPGGIAGSLCALVPDVCPDEAREQHGLLFLGGPNALDANNEVFVAQRSWNFSWLQTMDEWGTTEGLARARSADFAIVADPRYEFIARSLEERWGLSWLKLPISYRLEDIDANYRLLEERFGQVADLERFRNDAQNALAWALEAWYGRPLRIEVTGLARPWNLVQALLEYGFVIDKIYVGHMMPPHMDDESSEDDFAQLLQAYPDVDQCIEREQWNPRMGRPGFGARPMPPGGFGGGPGAGPGGPGQRPTRPFERPFSGGPDGPSDEGNRISEDACWGYFALWQCMHNLCDAAYRDDFRRFALYHGGLHAGLGQEV